jgi:hypothetical protein
MLPVMPIVFLHTLFGELGASSCVLARFMKETWLYLSDGNWFPENSGHSPQGVLHPVVGSALRGGET